LNPRPHTQQSTAVAQLKLYPCSQMSDEGGNVWQVQSQKVLYNRSMDWIQFKAFSLTDKEMEEKDVKKRSFFNYLLQKDHSKFAIGDCSYKTFSLAIVTPDK
jgi:hypothetical protein